MAGIRARIPPSRTASIGGVLAPAGDLVFQGDGGGFFSSYDSDSGQLLREVDACRSNIAPPVTCRIGNTRCVAVMTGTSYDFHQQGKILTFALVSSAQIPVPSRRILTRIGQR